MPEPFQQPLDEPVPTVTDDVAVGEDLNFQRKWWRFEHIIWAVFVAILICDLLGMFGRGGFANAKASTPDHALVLNYDRIERKDAPSVMTLHFGPAAVHNGRIEVTISETVLKDLGARRISPAPVISALGPKAITYVWYTTGLLSSVHITLRPSHAWSQRFAIQVVGSQPIEGSVLVFP
jgi:hypothetical protein